MVLNWTQKVAYITVPQVALALAAAIGAGTYGGEKIGVGAEKLADMYEGYVSDPARVTEMTIKENKKCKIRVISTDWETGVSKVGGNGCTSSNLNAGYVAPALPGLKQNSEVTITRDQRYVLEQVNMKYVQNTENAKSYVSKAKEFTAAAKDGQFYATVPAGAALAFPFIYAGVAVLGDLGRRLAGSGKPMVRRREEEPMIALENV